MPPGQDDFTVRIVEDDEQADYKVRVVANQVLDPASATPGDVPVVEDGQLVFQRRSGLVASSGTGAAITGTAETTLFSGTVPAGSSQPGDEYEMRVGALLQNSTGSPQVCIYRLKAGSTTLLTVGVSVPTGTGTRRMVVTADVLVESMGIVVPTWAIDATSASASGDTLGIAAALCVRGGADDVAVNMASAQALSVTVEQPANDPTNLLHRRFRGSLRRHAAA